MKKGLIYIHGKGGCAYEADHYRGLFPGYDVTGFAYLSQTPWEAQQEFSDFFDSFAETHSDILLIANSIGAFFALHSLAGKPIARAYFISPICDMQKLIADMLLWAGADEAQLRQQGTIETAFGETLSWQYLCWVREHPVRWSIPTAILYGSKDHLQSRETIAAFAESIEAPVTVLQGGEHWFHTPEQMDYLDRWILSTDGRV